MNRLSIGSVIPGLKKDDGNLDNQVQAGLASMETLDEKSGDEKADEKKDRDVERQEEANQANFRQFIKTYRYVIGELLHFFYYSQPTV